MITIPPNIVGLIFANRLEVDVEKHELSLMGLFQLKRFANFPTLPVEMIVFAIVNAGRGEGILQVAVYSLDADEDFDRSLDWVYRQQKWIKFPTDPNFPVCLELRIKNLVFVEPGEYLFVLTFDGKLIADRRISILQDSETHERI